MTLLTIAQNVADEVGVDQPTVVAGSPDPTAQKLLRYINKTGTGLMKKLAWQVLRKERAFTSISGETQTAILPSDFDRFIPETFWNRSTPVLMSGPVSAVQWQGLKATTYTGKPKFAYRGGDVLVIPALGAGDSLAFEYVSNQWCQSTGAVAQSAFAADTDTGILDEELITRGAKFVYLTDEGLPNALAGADFNDYLAVLSRNDQPSANIMVAADIFGGANARHFDGTPPGGDWTNW